MVVKKKNSTEGIRQIVFKASFVVLFKVAIRLKEKKKNVAKLKAFDKKNKKNSLIRKIF